MKVQEITVHYLYPSSVMLDDRFANFIKSIDDLVYSLCSSENGKITRWWSTTDVAVNHRILFVQGFWSWGSFSSSIQVQYWRVVSRLPSQADILDK